MSVKIKKIETDFERMYFNSCINSEEFKFYIGDAKKDIESAVIFCKGDQKYLGLLLPNIKMQGEMRLSIPIIYLTEKMTRESSWCIVNAISFIFEILLADKIQFIIYGFNYRSINLMNNFRIKFEGKLPHAVYVEGKCEDILYYSILREEYERLRERYNDRYTNI